MSQDNDAYAKFGIDEIYIQKSFPQSLLEKLHQRALFTLDAESLVVRKYASHDMVLIFHKQVPSQSLIYRFLEFLDQDPKKADFIKFNTLLNEEELFSTTKSKKFALVTNRIIPKEMHQPS